MNLGGIANSLKVSNGEEFIKYASNRTIFPDRGRADGVENTQQSKHAAHLTNSAAHRSATSARTAVPCCGCGIITIPN